MHGRPALVGGREVGKAREETNYSHPTITTCLKFRAGFAHSPPAAPAAPAGRRRRLQLAPVVHPPRTVGEAARPL